MPDIAGNLGSKKPFYKNAPQELRDSARELFKSNVFYRLNATPGQGGGSKYHYIGKNLEDDIEKSLILARSFLDKGHDYLTNIIKAKWA